MTRSLIALCAILAVPAVASSQPAGLRPVRIAKPVNGHIHPAICRTKTGTLVVIYGRVNHVDLRITRSTDGGRTWSLPKPFVHTVKKTYYPGSLTALKNGQILHAWNRWSTETNQKEPRSVLYSLSGDEGLTWSRPKPFPRDPKVRSIIRHPVVELAPNRWLVSLSDKTIVFDPRIGSGKPFGDGRVHGLIPIVRTPKGTFVSGAGLRSTDKGKTWKKIEGFPDLKSQGWRHEMVCLANGWLLASEILGPGFGGERIRYRISRDDGRSWKDVFEYYNPGRPIVGRACPRTVQLDARTIGVVFYDIAKKQKGGPGLFFLRIPLKTLRR
ncbi:MAG: sialidase family protein [Planctomycetaceae bacterium]